VKGRSTFDLGILENRCVQSGCPFSLFVEPQMRSDCLHWIFAPLFMEEERSKSTLNSIANTR
jgi:hypothetical protein